MFKVENKMKYNHMFNDYKHNVAVIYSALEGQYQSDLYMDDLDNPKFGILFTSFDYSYVFGNPKEAGLVEALRHLIFKDVLKNNQSKEALIIGPNEEWDETLRSVFKGYSDIVDTRVVYRLNKDKFLNLDIKESNDSEMKLILSEASEMDSNIMYPISRLMHNQNTISECSGFMIGKAHAEIDIKTEEGYRNMGYAKLTAIELIKELLSRGLEPDWNCWSTKENSQKLAEAIGFEKIKELATYIWVEEVSGKL